MAAIEMGRLRLDTQGFARLGEFPDLYHRDPTLERVGHPSVAIPAFKRLGYFHVVPVGTYRNAAAASTPAVNGPRKPVMNQIFSTQYSSRLKNRRHESGRMTCMRAIRYMRFTLPGNESGVCSECGEAHAH